MHESGDFCKRTQSKNSQTTHIKLAVKRCAIYLSSCSRSRQRELARQFQRTRAPTLSRSTGSTRCREINWHMSFKYRWWTSGIDTITWCIIFKDSAAPVHCTFRDFVRYRQRSWETFAIFIVEFVKRYRDMKRHEVKFPADAKAHFLL